MAIEKDEHGTPVYPGGIPLQITAWTERRAFINVIVTTVRVILPAGAEIIELTVTENCFINFGDVTVDASSTIATDGSRLFLAGVQTIRVPVDSSGVPFTYIAAIRQATDGILQIEELE